MVNCQVRLIELSSLFLNLKTIILKFKEKKNNKIKNNNLESSANSSKFLNNKKNLQEKVMADKQQLQEKMVKVLDWSYEKALNGLPGTESALELGECYLRNNGNLLDKTNCLIRWQISKTATSGFLTGLGGLITLPVAIPVNIASVVYVQMRMIAAIAHIGGYDIKSDQVRGLVYVCLAGNEAKDILKNLGIQFGTKLSNSMIKRYVTGAALTKINRAVGFRLITKFGTKGVVNLGKAIPLVGGVIGGSIDALSTNKIGNVARDCFVTPQQNTDMSIENGEDRKQIISEMSCESQIMNVELIKLYSYLNLLKIDGKITDEEVELLEAFINESDLSNDEKMEIIGKISNTSIINVDYSSLKNDMEQSIILLNNLVAMSKSDGQIHPTEKIFIKNVGRQLGLPDQDVIDLIQQ